MIFFYFFSWPSQHRPGCSSEGWFSGLSRISEVWFCLCFSCPMTMDPNFSSTKTYHISLPNMLEIHQKKKNSRNDTLFFSEISMGGMELILIKCFLKEWRRNKGKTEEGEGEKGKRKKGGRETEKRKEGKEGKREGGREGIVFVWGEALWQYRET